MPSYKLTYFEARGRAESTRMIFKQAGVEFEDKRVAGEDWLKLKPTTPYGSLPILEVDGKVLAGSACISRLLAERFGLAGSSDIENAEIASIVDSIGDFAQEIYKARFEKDETRKEKLKKKMGEEVIPKYLGKYEKLILTNGSPEGWLHGSNVTYADFTMFCTIKYLKDIPNVFDKTPSIKKNIESVSKFPNIAKWFEERPKSAF